MSLRLQGSGEESAPNLSEDHLTAILDAMMRIENRAMSLGLSLAPSTAAQIVGLRGILDGPAAETDTKALCTRLLSDFEGVLADFTAMRAAEGQALQGILTTQLDEIAALTAEAAAQSDARRSEQSEKLRAALARVMENAEGAEPQRVAQELALLAVKADVTEELDRLRGACARGPRSAGRGGAGRAQARFPDAGIQPRGQHALFQGAGLRR